MQRYDRDRGFGWGGRGRRYGGDFQGGEGRWRGPFRGGGGGYDRGIYGEEHPGYGGYPGGPDRGMYYGGRGGGRGGYGGFGGFGGFGGAGGHGGSGGFGGHSGLREEFARRYGFEYGSERGWQGGSGREGQRNRYPRYDSAYADGPFMPEEAYTRHPEYDRPQRHVQDRWPAAPSGAQGGYEVSDDSEILQAVRQNLYQDNWIDPERIEVEVEDGVVTLKGEVDDFLEARYAWDDAWETSGVRGVINHIHVRVDGPAGRHDSVLQTSSGGEGTPAPGKKGGTGGKAKARPGGASKSAKD